MLNRPLVLVFASSFGFSASFYLLLSVVPLYAASVGAGGAGAGLATGALMLSTVSAELVTPLLRYRFGYRAMFAAGLVLLGAPEFALGALPTVAGIFSVCLARGFALGIVLVVGGGCIFIRPCNIAPILDPSGRDLGPQAPKNPHYDLPQRMITSPTSEEAVCR